MSLPAPSPASRYQWQEPLGQGGAGTVHAAWDTLLDRPVAIKTVARQEGVDGLREARLTARLRHPAFVAVHEAWNDGEKVHIVMERVPGQTLKQWLTEHGPAPVAAASAWMLQLAQAMAEAHAEGLVHGDLKPSNLMLEPVADGAAPGRARLRVLDLGIARHVDPLATRTQEAMPGPESGTLAYMAPEQLRGEAATPASDIYALGLVLLQCLLGRLGEAQTPSLALAWRRLQGTWRDWALTPLASSPATDSTTGTTAETATGTLPTLSAVQRLALCPPSLIALLDRLLAVEAPQRPTGMTEVGEALQDVLAELTQPTATGTASANARGVLPSEFIAPATRSAPGPTAPATPRPRWLRRHPWAAITLAVALLAGSGAAAWWLQPGSSLWAPSAEQILADLQKAEAYLNEFDDRESLDKAIYLLDGLSQQVPDNAPVGAMASIAHALRYSEKTGDDPAQDLEMSRTLAKRSLDEDGQLARAHLAQALVLRRLDRPADAMKEFERSRLLNPLDMFALSFQAYALMSSGAAGMDRAFALLDPAVKLHPLDSGLLEVWATLNYRRGNYVEAERSFRLNLSVRPTSSVAAFSLSAILMMQGRNDDALAVLQQALQVRPHPRLYGNLGAVLAVKGLWADAIQAYQRALAIWPKQLPNAFMYGNLGEAYSHLPGHEAEAQTAWKQAWEGARRMAQLSPRDPDWASQQGVFAARVGQAAEARQAMARALTLAPQQPVILYRGALSEALLGAPETSRPLLQRALAAGYPPDMVKIEPALAPLLPTAASRPQPRTAKPARAGSTP